MYLLQSEVRRLCEVFTHLLEVDCSHLLSRYINASSYWLFVHEFALAAICDIGNVGLSLYVISQFLSKIYFGHLNNGEVIFVSKQDLGSSFF